MATLLAIPFLLGFVLSVRHHSFARQLQARPNTPRKLHGIQRLKFVSQGRTETYCLYIPDSLDMNAAAPLVIVLHGAGGEGEPYLTKNNWEREAESGRFVVLAPDGLPVRMSIAPRFLTNPRVWNSGQLRQGSPRTAFDDVRYLIELLDTIELSLAIDTKRVYVCGHSNGSSMTFLLASRSAKRFAAIGALAGQCMESAPHPSRKVPTLYVIGDKDPLNPLSGGKRSTPWETTEVPPVFEQLQWWAKGLGLSGTPEVVSDDATKKVLRFGPEFTTWVIKGQGHMWPGGSEFGLNQRMVGPSANTVDLTHEFWMFFKHYTNS